MVNGGDPSSAAISQGGAGLLAKIGLNVQLTCWHAEFTTALLAGKFNALFGGIGNIQKFPTRVTTNSIYRTSKNPVLGDPHPHPAWRPRSTRVNSTFGTGARSRPPTTTSTKAMVEAAFAIPTNTYDIGLIVAAKNVGGIVREIDNMPVFPDHGPGEKRR